MEKINQSDLASLKLLKTGKKTAVRVAIEELQVGEILKIEAKDWNQMKPPGYLCRSLEKTRKRKLRDTRYDGGWVIERLR